MSKIEIVTTEEEANKYTTKLSLRFSDKDVNFIITLDGIITSYVRVFVDENSMLVAMMETDVDYKGMGFNRELMEYIIKFTNLDLYAVPVNQKVGRYLERLGFYGYGDRVMVRNINGN